jgi:hypothetical protein
MDAINDETSDCTCHAFDGFFNSISWRLPALVVLDAACHAKLPVLWSPPAAAQLLVQVYFKFLACRIRQL